MNGAVNGILPLKSSGDRIERRTQPGTVVMQVNLTDMVDPPWRVIASSRKTTKILSFSFPPKELTWMLKGDCFVAGRAPAPRNDKCGEVVPSRKTSAPAH